MHRLGLAAFGPPARLHAARLERFEVGARRNLAVRVLRRQPDFEVVGLGRGEADVAGAKRDHAIGKLEALEDRLGVPGELLQALVGALGGNDLHQLHLVELVVADHAASVLARRARLGAEARRMAGELERQLLGRQDLLAREIRDRVLGGRQQVEVAPLDLEQILLELREARDAVCASARCRRATSPFMTTKRLPATFAAVSKSMPPSAAPMSTWSLGAKENFRGSPQRRSSRLSSAEAPTGTDSCGRLGMRSRKSWNAACSFSSCSSDCSSSDFSFSPCRMSSATSWPFAFAWPMSLAMRLRDACACCTAVCSSLRVDSKRSNWPRSKVPGPRAARRWATSCGFFLSSWRSIISWP